MTNEVMVVDRGVLNGVGPYVRWGDAADLLADLDARYGWMPRSDAERSSTLFQPIACAIVVNGEGHYCVLRQGDDPSKVLARKRTLVVGGHIDRDDESGGFLPTVTHALAREIAEETGIDVQAHPPEPFCLLVDRRTEVSRRHVGVVHRVVADRIEPTDGQEFTLGIADRLFVPPSRMAEMRDEFDPWSATLITHLTAACRGT